MDRQVSRLDLFTHYTFSDNCSSDEHVVTAASITTGRGHGKTARSGLALLKGEESLDFRGDGLQAWHVLRLEDGQPDPGGVA
jgi:hypothetical protein